jgi:enediyne biosynthesis protein E4
MEPQSTFLKRKAAMIVGLGIVATLYAATRLPELPENDRLALAARYRFTSTPLQEDADVGGRTVRPVHPSLKRINAWISSVGAAAALGDADGDGLPNDVCHVDPRTDSVTLAPVPGSSARYGRFTLKPRTLTYDETMAPMGCLLTDLIEDGRLDALV